MIEIEDLSLSLRGRKILDRINLKVEAGERLVVLGASGSGKTTLLRLIAGFVAPDTGLLRIAGQIVSKQGNVIVAPYERGVNMVFQDLALWPHMNVGENIAFGLKMQGVGRKERIQRMVEMLEMVGLSGYEKKRINTLSGGEQQRVALARALVTEPEILLMDEPLSSLDPQLSRKLCDEIVRLQKRLGFTLIYVTHSETEAKAIATCMIYIREGNILTFS